MRGPRPVSRAPERRIPEKEGGERQSRKLGFGVATFFSFTSEQDLLGRDRRPLSCKRALLTKNNIAAVLLVDRLAIRSV